MSDRLHGIGDSDFSRDLSDPQPKSSFSSSTQPAAKMPRRTLGLRVRFKSQAALDARCFCFSVDGLCPEEGFKGVWVSRSIVVVVLVGL